jgi:hypothetical protein
MLDHIVEQQESREPILPLPKEARGDWELLHTRTNLDFIIMTMRRH